MRLPFLSAYGEDQSLQVAFGTSVFPERLDNSIRLLSGVEPRQLMVPHLATVSASRTVDT